MIVIKFWYTSPVKRGSGSSRKYSFSVPVMAFTSISLIMTDTSLLSAEKTTVGGIITNKGCFQQHSYMYKLKLTGIKRSLQRQDLRHDSRHSVESHFIHPSALNLLHTLSHNEGNFGALPPGGRVRSTHLIQDSKRKNKLLFMVFSV